MSEVHEAVGSYVVDALDPAERDEFEAHLPGCARCQIEVAEFSEAIAELTSLVAISPPATLRESLLAAIGEAAPLARSEGVRVEQQTTFGAARSAQPVVRTSVFAGGSTDAHAVVTDEVAPLEEHPSVMPDWPSWSVPPTNSGAERAVRRLRRRQRVLTALVAAATIVALALGGWVHGLAQRNREQVAATQQETALLSAPDAKVLTSTLNGASVVYVVSRQQDRALLMASGLADPAAGSTYQLWTLRGTKATSAGLVGRGGTVRQLFSGSVAGADALAVSDEPSPTGSPTPSLPPLSRVSL